MQRPTLLLLISLLILTSSCHVARYVWWNYADIHDTEKFPVVPIDKPAVSKSLTHSISDIKIPLPTSFIKEEREISLETYLQEHKTVAFLVIRNDTLLYEKYFGGFTRESVLPSFSVAKSFVSALVGIAIREGKIKSVDQPVTDFIPELSDQGFKAVTPSGRWGNFITGSI